MFFNNIYGSRGSGKTYQLVSQCHQFLTDNPDEKLTFIATYPKYVEDMYNRRFGKDKRISFMDYTVNLREIDGKKIFDNLDVYLKRNNVVAYSMNSGG